MKFIDERGFIFGRLNVADAVVLVALAGLVFGTVSLVYGIGQPPQQTKGVVVETPPVPDYVASEIQRDRFRLLKSSVSTRRVSSHPTRSPSNCDSTSL
jgi:hypothetical protein